MPSDSQPVQSLLASLEPSLHEGVYVFCSLPLGANLDGLDPIGTFREIEGLTVILEESSALAANLPILFRAAWITLTVESSLEAVGLTQAFSTALGEAQISCNIAAGAHHDHLFVPVLAAHQAIAVLHELQASAQSG